MKLLLLALILVMTCGFRVGDLEVVGTMQINPLTNCDTVDTNGSGLLACGTDDDVPEAGEVDPWTGDNAETIDNATDDMIEFQGVGGADNTDFRINLDGTRPVIDSPTDTSIQFDDTIILGTTNTTPGEFLHIVPTATHSNAIFMRGGQNPFTGAGTTYGIRAERTIDSTANTTSSLRLIYGRGDINKSISGAISATSENHYGHFVDLTHVGTISATFSGANFDSNVKGFFFFGRQGATWTSNKGRSNAYGLDVEGRVDSMFDNATSNFGVNAYGVKAIARSIPTNTASLSLVTNTYGAYLDAISNSAGGTRNVYGLYVNSATGGTTNYAGYFTGNVHITGALTGGDIIALGDTTAELDVRRTSQSLDHTNVTGSGTLAVYGDFSNASNLSYCVEITDNGDVDDDTEANRPVFRWSDAGCASWDESGIIASTIPYNLNNGIHIVFTAGTGTDFNLNDYVTWTSIGTTNQISTLKVDTTNSKVYVADGIDVEGAKDMDYGSADVTDHTFVTDGTGTAEIVLPAGSIDGTEILDDTIREADLKAVDAAVDEDILTYEFTTGDFEWITPNAGTDVTADLEEDAHCSEHDSTDVDCSGETIIVVDDQHAHTTTTISGIVAADMGDSDHGDVSWTTQVATVQDLQCTNCIGDTEITTHAGTSLAADLAEEGESGWTDGGTSVTLLTSTDNVGIGGAALGKLSVDGDTDEAQLLIQGNATQTSNLVTFETSAGTDLVTVTNGGVVTISSTTAQSTFTDGVTVNNDSGGTATDDLIANGDTVAGLFTVDASGDAVGINNTTPAQSFVVTGPSAETITAGATITANACGTIKQVTAAGAVTTGTTNTFTAPAAANSGCIMWVCNTGANAITLDDNANFNGSGIGGATPGDTVLGATDCVGVISNGSAWFQLGPGGQN